MSEADQTFVSTADIAQLRSDFQQQYPKAERLRLCMIEQLTTLLNANGIALGVPLESRVKQWSSIESKINRKGYSIKEVEKLNDLVGIRLIILFSRDHAPLERIINYSFDVISHEDASQRLSESQFGYRSHHYNVRLKKQWLEVPSFSDLGSIAVEIQARTIAQHIWAAASHKLQYKHEESVPPPLRRTINRISALLETVDLEFERVLEQRSEYIVDVDKGADRPLDVNAVDVIARRISPEANRDPDDDHLDEVLRDLRELGIDTTLKLEELLASHLPAVMAADKRHVPELGANDDPDYEKTARGVYFTFAGLIRQALIEEFGAARVREAMRTGRQGGIDLAP